MTREELRTNVRDMRLSAGAFVRRYAASRVPLVPEQTVESIIGALGDISIDEACAALDRIDAELAFPSTVQEQEPTS